MKKLSDSVINDFAIFYKNKLMKSQRNVERIKRFYNDDDSFDVLIKRVIDKLMVSTQPWIVLYSLIDLVEAEGVEVEPLDGLTENFPSVLIEYRGWTFARTHGQGTVLSIYDKDKKLIYRE
jgi:hypothetical protein